ncbi:MAG: hypothetical protein JWN44_2403 [Myxococcales bacterium]|nr:hypothetical protein [Myxococcales bacterium]
MTAMRALALIVVAVVGCSSPGAREAPDLAGASCMFASTGASVAAESCAATVCHPVGAGFESVSVTTSATFHGSFDVDGSLAVRSYTVAELRSFDILLDANGKKYAAGKGLSGRVIAGSSAALTIASVTEPSGAGCGSGVHGSATATLVEYDPATGMPTGSGVVGVTLGF